jgi:hypothetical protein
MSAGEFQHLLTLFGAYFHQDWSLEGDNWLAIIRNYCRDVSAADAASAAREIEAFLAVGDSEEDLSARFIREFGCYYDPRPDLGGPSWRTWLVQVATALRQTTG